MSLDARVVVAPRGVDASVSIPRGGTLALVGPNGSGKTTVLEALAGLVDPTGGHARLGERELWGTEGGRVRALEARERAVGIVPQDGVLLGHLSVGANVAYPLRARGASRAHAASGAGAALERVGLAHLASARPGALSAGQQRRVAVARALASRPALLLLDEPFAALDVEAAASLRDVVASLRGDVTTLIATHEAADAMLLADAVAVMASGSVVEEGAPAEVLSRPRTPFAAAFAGLSRYEGTWDGSALVLARGERLAATCDLAPGTPALVAVPPSRMSLVPPGTAGAFDDAVRRVEPGAAGWVRVLGEAAVAEVPAATALPSPGEAVAFLPVEPPRAYAI